MKMIIKLQVPLATNDANPRALAYSEGRKVQELLPITEELLKLMKGKKKKYFEAVVTGKNIEFGREVGAQPW